VLDSQPRTANATAGEVTELFVAVAVRFHGPFLEREPKVDVRIIELLFFAAAAGKRAEWKKSMLHPLPLRHRPAGSRAANDFAPRLHLSQEQARHPLVGAARESVNRQLHPGAMTSFSICSAAAYCLQNQNKLTAIARTDCGAFTARVAPDPSNRAPRNAGHIVMNRLARQVGAFLLARSRRARLGCGPPHRRGRGLPCDAPPEKIPDWL